jgi:hypothetical protein
MHLLTLPRRIGTQLPRALLMVKMMVLVVMVVVALYGGVLVYERCLNHRNC